MKILSSKEIKFLDQKTIENQEISSLELMERASQVFADWFLNSYLDESIPIYVFCGPGNNGGDGINVARILSQSFRKVHLILCEIGEDKSKDFEASLEKISKNQLEDLIYLKESDPYPNLSPDHLIVDAIFGTGLNRPVLGYWSKLIEHINQCGGEIISVDIPSGLYADKSSLDNISIHAQKTLSFELTKRAFLFAENENRVGEWLSKSIGLDLKATQELTSKYFLLDLKDVKKLWQNRSRFAHKGNFGHALLLAGSYGKTGAALLAGEACLRSGCGLLSIHCPKSSYEILQSSLPEAMLSVDPHESVISSLPKLESYASIGFGPGMGQNEIVDHLVKSILESNKPLVIDADGLNIISKNKWQGKIPVNSILTPHVKEFERLFGASKNDFERNDLQIKTSVDLKIFIILKGANTSISTPRGLCYYNSTGNPGMATAGSGDVLCGILTGFLAQGYSFESACKLSVYLHGLAGDLAAEEVGFEALIARDIITKLGPAFKKLKK